MEALKTPLRVTKQFQDVLIPPSPFMKKIGYGAGVAVYEMQRSPVFNKSNSPWAVKKLLHKCKHNEELNSRLIEEADVLRKLKHPNIVGFRAFVKDPDGRNVLVMEECTSCLGDMIEERNDPYPVDTITKVALDIAKALEYLHNDALLLHCDVKSFNILINGNFSVCKLCDFGVCLPITKTGELDLEKVDAETEYIGTPAWSAPEILKYPQEITSKADIYAFGLVIWEMIALSPPVDDDLVKSAENSLLSEDALESSIVCEFENTPRKRPALPDFDLTEDYNGILEVFYCCTEVNRNKRPTAEDLVVIVAEI